MSILQPSNIEQSYVDLEKFLAAQAWKHADQKTREIVRFLAECSQNDWIDVEDIEKLSCADLLKIDKLWTHHSDGQFGLRVQQKIWQEVGGSSDVSYEIKCQFGERIGWYANGSWLLWNRLDFSLSAPIGHLPARGFGGWLGWRVGLIDFWIALFMRFEECELQIAQSNNPMHTDR